jgi:hypothetical protein
MTNAQIPMSIQNPLVIGSLVIGISLDRRLHVRVSGR